MTKLFIFLRAFVRRINVRVWLWRIDNLRRLYPNGELYLSPEMYDVFFKEVEKMNHRADSIYFSPQKISFKERLAPGIWFYYCYDWERVVAGGQWKFPPRSV